MKFEFQIDPNGWEFEDSYWEQIRVVAQDAMAIRFSDIVLQNFGDTGLDRPAEWKSLNPIYAIKAHDGDTTPTLVLSGDLRSSIDVELGNPESSSVFTNNPYAAEHQYGDPERNLPARPFFPIDAEGNLTPFAEAEMVSAAEQALASFLS